MRPAAEEPLLVVMTSFEARASATIPPARTGVFGCLVSAGLAFFVFPRAFLVLASLVFSRTLSTTDFSFPR